MNTKINNFKRNGAPRSGRVSGKILAALTLAACLGAPINSRARAQTYVTSSGSFAPEADNLDRPFRLVESAIAADRIDSHIAVSPGIYREAFIADSPCVIEPSDAGVITIGDLSAVATTTLKIATLNTHLFGDTVFTSSWQDDQRAIDIGNICAASDWDVVAFQEIWDEDLFGGGDGQKGILPVSGFEFGHHGTDTDCILCGNSGLAVMSNFDITRFDQEFFSDCPSSPCAGKFDDCLAAKGWVEAEITKDGFPIVIFNTHTQAGNDDNQVGARLFQMICMLSRALHVRELDPEATVVIVGDFNIPGETDKYMFYVNLFAGDPSFLFDLFPAVLADIIIAGFNGRYEEISGFTDGARNIPGFHQDDHYTNSPDNELSLCFDINTFNARLDYVLVIPPEDDSITVIPESVNVFRFLGQELTDTCCLDPACDVNYELTSPEKSDHWGVEAELKFFRN